VECAEYAAHAIRRALYVKKDRKPQWPSLRLSGFGLAFTVFPQQNTRITFRLKTPQTRFRSSVLSTGREHWRLAQLCWRVLRWIVGRKMKIFFGLCWFSVNINLYGTIAQHGYSRVQRESTLALVSQARSIVNWVLPSMEFTCWWKRSVSVLFKHTFPLCWRWQDLRHCADSALTGDPIVKPNTCW